jgi:mono/diheme cytochrome c family protein
LGALSVVVAAAMGCEGQDAPVIKTLDPPAELSNPRPLSGGSLVVSRDGRIAVAADGDLDQLHVFDLADLSLTASHDLEPGDEPGRIVEGEGGVMYVAMRSSGHIVRLDTASGALARALACPAPRALAYDAVHGSVHVACAGGELVTFSTALDKTRELRLDRDLRDVVVSGDRLVVSRFRAAEALVLDSEGEVLHRVVPYGFLSITERTFEPAVAWRMRLLGNGMIVMIHQRGLVDEVPIDGTGNGEHGPGSYGGSCDGSIVHAAATVFDPATGRIENLDQTGGLGTLVLPMDADVAPDGRRVAVVAAGNDRLFLSDVGDIVSSDAINNCFPSGSQLELRVTGEPIAVAFTPSGEILVQSRQPAALHRIDPNQVRFDELNPLGVAEPTASATIPGPSRRHFGHAIFHKAASEFSPIACASCHPEAREDGRVWQFAGMGARRTQNVSGGLLATAPLHWDGEFDGMHDLVGEVFVERMGGASPDESRLDSLASWLDAQPALPPSEPLDPEAVSRGEALYHDAEVGCAGCHGGAHLTNNATVDVGTGRPLQVPSLTAIAHRAPFMHDGCADTLSARFLSDPACTGADAHGHVSGLSQADVADLVAYLETL